MIFQHVEAIKDLSLHMIYSFSQTGGGHKRCHNADFPDLLQVERLGVPGFLTSYSLQSLSLLRDLSDMDSSQPSNCMWAFPHHSSNTEDVCKWDILQPPQGNAPVSALSAAGFSEWLQSMQWMAANCPLSHFYSSEHLHTGETSIATSLPMRLW